MSTHTIMHITDTHLREDPFAKVVDVTTENSLAAVLDAAFGEREPDLVLATGDIADQGSSVAYRRFRDHIVSRTEAPLVCLPGNHDLSDAFGETSKPAALGPWQIIPIDSHVDNQVGGSVSTEEVARLASALDTAEDNVIVALHHPVLPCGSPWLDKDGVFSGPFIEVIESSKKIRCVVYGHIHQPFEKWHNGVLYLGTPSTCYQFSLNSQSFSIDPSPPGYRWLTLADSGDISTQVIKLETNNF